MTERTNAGIVLIKMKPNALHFDGKWQAKFVEERKKERRKLKLSSGESVSAQSRSNRKQSARKPKSKFVNVNWNCRKTRKEIKTKMCAERAEKKKILFRSRRRNWAKTVCTEKNRAIAQNERRREVNKNRREKTVKTKSESVGKRMCEHLLKHKRIACRKRQEEEEK